MYGSGSWNILENTINDDLIAWVRSYINNRHLEKKKVASMKREYMKFWDHWKSRAECEIASMRF